MDKSKKKTTGWSIGPVWYGKDEMAIYWGRTVIAYIDKEQAEIAFKAITAAFPDGPT